MNLIEKRLVSGAFAAVLLGAMVEAMPEDLRVTESVSSSYKTQFGYDDTAGKDLTEAAGIDDIDRMKKILADRGHVDPDYRKGMPLKAAVYGGHIRAVETLIDAGAKIDIDNGMVMAIAMDEGQRDIVSLLINRKSDLFLPAVEDALDRMEAVKRGPNYAQSRYARPGYDGIADLVRDGRKRQDPGRAATAKPTLRDHARFCPPSL